MRDDVEGQQVGEHVVLAVPPVAIAAAPSSSSFIPGAPAPDAAWYVDMMHFLMPKVSCSGFSAISAIAVVQFGFATSFFFDFRAASALISGTTSATSSS